MQAQTSTTSTNPNTITHPTNPELPKYDPYKGHQELKNEPKDHNLNDKQEQKENQRREKIVKGGQEKGVDPLPIDVEEEQRKERQRRRLFQNKNERVIAERGTVERGGNFDTRYRCGI